MRPDMESVQSASDGNDENDNFRAKPDFGNVQKRRSKLLPP